MWGTKSRQSGGVHLFVFLYLLLRIFGSLESKDVNDSFFFFFSIKIIAAIFGSCFSGDISETNNI